MIISKSLFKSVAIISIFSILSRSLSFIYKIILSNQINTTELGVYSVAVSVCMIFLTILTAGLPLIVSRSTAESYIDKNNKKVFRVISSGILLSICLSILVTISIIIFKPLFGLIFADNNSYIVLLTLIPFLISSGIYAPVKGFLWGKEDFFSVSLVELFEQVIKIILCFILFQYISNPHLPAGIAMSISCIASTIFGFVIYFRKKGKLSTPFPEFKSTIKQSMPITLIRVASTLLHPLISIVLPLQLVNAGYSNTQSMSLLGIAMGMTFPLLTIPTTLTGSLSMALTPKLTVLQKNNDTHNLKKQIINSITFTLFSCFIFVPIFFALGVPMCEFLFKNTSSGILLSQFCWVVIPMCLCQLTSSLLNSICEEKFVLYTYFIGSIAMIISIIFLPQYMGISSLLIGIGIQNCIICVLNILKINKILNSDINILPLLSKFIIISLLVGIFSKWLYSILNIVCSSFMSMVLVSITGSIAFIVLVYAFGIYNLQLYIHKKKEHSRV